MIGGDQVVTLTFNGISKGIEDAAGRSGSALTTFGKVAGIAALGVGAALFKIGDTFDNMSDTIATTTGASGKALDDMVNSAKKIATEVPASFEDASVAISMVKQKLDLTGPALESSTKQFLQLAKVTGGDVTSQIEKSSEAFRKWGISAQNQGVILDKMYYVSQQTGVGVEDLAEKLTKFQNPLQAMGFNMNQSIAMLGKWTKEGVNVDQVLSAMSKGFATMAKKGLDPIKTFDDVSKSIKNAKTDSEAAGIAMELFGAKAGPELASAIRAGNLEVGDLLKGMSNSKGIINESEKSTRDFAESWQMFYNKVLVKLEPLASAFFSGLSTAMGWIADNAIPIIQTLATWIGDNLGTAIQNVTEWVKDNSTWLTALAAAMGVLLIPVAAYATWLGIVTVATGLWTAVTNVATVAIRLFNLAMEANPFILVATLIAALVTAFVVLWNKSAAFRQFFIDMWNGIKDVVGTVVQWVIDRWNGVISFFTTLRDTIGGIFNTVGDGIKQGFKNAINFVIDIINKAIGFINTIIHGINWVSDWVGIPPIPDIPKVPRLHTGGIVPGQPGSEVMILARAGEKVSTRGTSGSDGAVRFLGNTDTALAKLIMGMVKRGEIRLEA
jgi:TP901 family phage tail tape measure protein